MQIVIIGNGIAGITAAVSCRKLGNDPITVISSESKYFYSRTALMYIYMGHMRFEDTKPYQDNFWHQNNIELIQDKVTEIDHQNSVLSIKSGGKISYDKLVIATGSKPNIFAWPGVDLQGVFSMYHLHDLEKINSITENCKRAIVVGGGLIGIEIVEMLRSRNIEVTFLVREKNFWDIVLPKEESEMIEKEIRSHGVDLRLSTELASINSDDGKKIHSITTNSGETIPTEVVGIAVGVAPNIDMFKNSAIDVNRGILVDSQLRTNISNVYACGDCCELRNPSNGRRAIEPIWYTGRLMGEVVAKNIYNHELDYNPGVWFNSAKFFNIEYQIYGTVNPKLEENERTIFWRNKEKNKSIRINFDSKSMVVLGINLLGIRYRHEVCNAWLVNKTHIEEVLQNLKIANFDGEFSSLYESELIDQYNNVFHKNIKTKAKRGHDSVLEFFNKILSTK
ncbi:MAG: NAD(P)/FAD-dependent oxidoreductase [Saprospiraceae bacterium]|nr:NAD(P)/FAD-dependent oxidoreductase [Saprospiraceae bacterium]